MCIFKKRWGNSCWAWNKLSEFCVLVQDWYLDYIVLSIYYSKLKQHELQESSRCCKLFLLTPRGAFQLQHQYFRSFRGFLELFAQLVKLEKISKKSKFRLWFHCLDYGPVTLLACNPFELDCLLVYLWYLLFIHAFLFIRKRSINK